MLCKENKVSWRSFCCSLFLGMAGNHSKLLLLNGRTPGHTKAAARCARQAQHVLEWQAESERWQHMLALPKPTHFAEFRAHIAGHPKVLSASFLWQGAAMPSDVLVQGCGVVGSESRV